MRFLVDTNVLVSATVKELPGHEHAMNFIEQVLVGRGPWCLSWVNIYEFLRVTTHRRVFKKPLKWTESHEQITALLSHPTLQILTETPRHAEVLKTTIMEAGGASGNFLHDCHIAALMKEHDVTTIITADSHFRRFPGLQVCAPEEAVRSS